MHCRAYFLLERDFQELKENDFKVSVGTWRGVFCWEYEVFCFLF